MPTDHPSNPPSQEPSGEWMYRAALTVHIVGRCPDLRHGGLGLKACGPCYRVADALAAQEARHQEQREVDAAAIRLSLGMLATEEARHKAALDAMRDERDTWAGIAGRNAGALVEAESKLREATEALRQIAGDESGMGVHRPCCARGQRIALAAIRSGPAQQAAPRSLFGWVGRRIGDHVQTADCDATCLDCQDGGFGSDGLVKSDPPAPRHPVELCKAMQHAEGCQGPEQETPKPRGLMSLRGIAPDITGDLSSEEYLKLNWAGEIVYCACGRPTAGPAQCSKCAPPAHGGGD